MIRRTFVLALLSLAHGCQSQSGGTASSRPPRPSDAAPPAARQGVQGVQILVLGHDDAPLAGATVRSAPSGSELRTGPDGRCILSAVGAEVVRVVVEAPPLVPLEADVRGGSGEHVFRLRHRRRHAVWVQVSDARRRLSSVSNVRIRTASSNPAMNQIWYRYGGGKFRIRLDDTSAGRGGAEPLVAYAVLADGRLGVSGPIDLAAGDGQVHVEFSVRKGVEVRGTVRGPGGIGIANATVRYAPIRDGQPTLDYSDKFAPARWLDWPGVQTDAEGRYSIRVTGPGPYLLDVEIEGHVMLARPRFQPGDRAVDVTLVPPEPSVQVRGRLEDSSGRAIPGANVHLHGESADTDRDGWFELPRKVRAGVGPASISLGSGLGVPASEIPEPEVPLSKDGEIHLRLRGQPWVKRVAGRITRDGVPWARAQVRLFRTKFDVAAAEVSADEAGRFSVGPLPPGDYILGVAPDELELAWYAQPLVVRPGMPEISVDVRVAKLQGRVDLPEMEPLPATAYPLRVRLYPTSSANLGVFCFADSSEDVVAELDPDGSFAFPRLPAGSYRAAVLRDELMLGRAVLRLAPGERRRGLRLRGERPGSIVGRVVDADGRPVVKAMADLVFRDDPAWEPVGYETPYGTPFTDADGMFRFPAVPAGRIRLEVELLDTPRVEEVDLVVRSGETMSVEVRLP